MTVVERDGGPPLGTPSDDVDRWSHSGVPQARQSHALLGRARRVLVDEAPDVVAALLSRGVHEIPVVLGAGKLDEWMLLSRRLVAEAELRRIVAREPGVTLLDHDANRRTTGLRILLPDSFLQCEAGMRDPDQQDSGIDRTRLRDGFRSRRRQRHLLPDGDVVRRRSVPHSSPQARLLRDLPARRTALGTVDTRWDADQRRCDDVEDREPTRRCTPIQRSDVGSRWA